MRAFLCLCALVVLVGCGSSSSGADSDSVMLSNCEKNFADLAGRNYRYIDPEGDVIYSVSFTDSSFESRSWSTVGSWADNGPSNDNGTIGLYEKSSLECYSETKATIIASETTEELCSNDGVSASWNCGTYWSPKRSLTIDFSTDSSLIVSENQAYPVAVGEFYRIR